MKIVLDPLLAEEWPDGTFGGARAARGKRPKRRTGPDPHAAAHRAALDAELRQLARRKRADRCAAA